MNNKNPEFRGVIRPVLDHDLGTVRDMVSGLARHHGDVATVTLAQLARDILEPHPWVRVLLAESEGVCIGYAALCPLSKMQFGMRGMDLLHLYVVPEARRTGVAKALIKASQDIAEQNGCDYLAVGTHPDNKVAQGIYRALGFDSLDTTGPRFSIALTPKA